MSPLQWALRPLRQYAVFSGRATRAEYWWFAAFNFVVAFAICFVIGFVCGVLGINQSSIGQGLNVFVGIWLLATLVPGIALSVRRLHDVGMNGWWCLMSLVPVLGLVLLFFYAKPSQTGTNNYGPNPSIVRANLSRQIVAAGAD